MIVAQELTQALGSLGFELWRPPSGSHPLVVHLARSVGSRRDLIDVQFDKRGRRTCFFNLAIVKGEQTETMFDGTVASDSVEIVQLRWRCRLWGRRLVGAFGPPLLLAPFISDLGSARSVVDQITRRLQAIGEFFSSGKIDPRIRCLDL
jgi:hypothetical protein